MCYYYPMLLISWIVCDHKMNLKSFLVAFMEKNMEKKAVIVKHEFSQNYFSI